MNSKSLLMFGLCLLFQSIYAQDKKDYEIHTIAFYNVENLFDTINNPETFDDDRSATGKDVWNTKKYNAKIENISRVLAEIGRETTKETPAIIGLCEVENRQVLEDLINHAHLQDQHYGIIHFDSPDERGIDVALLYKKQFFQPINSQARKLIIYEADNPGKRDYTRDQLVVSGYLNKEEVHFIVNHWPSRGGGEARSAYKREKAAILNRRIIDSLVKLNPEAKIISMGDFNDDPTNKSFKKILKTTGSKNGILPGDLFNPMETMLKTGKGSLAYRDSWNLFDQIYMTGNLILGKDSGFKFYQAGIFSSPFLITSTGQFRGYPARTYGYSGYEGGYSDHFPVYIYLIRAINTN